MWTDTGKTLQVLIGWITPQENRPNTLLWKECPGVVVVGNHGKLSGNTVGWHGLQRRDSHEFVEISGGVPVGTLAAFDGIQENADSRHERKQGYHPSANNGQEFDKPTPWSQVVVVSFG